MVGLYYGVAEEEHGTNLENTPTFSFQRPGEGDCWPPWFNRIFECLSALERANREQSRPEHHLFETERVQIQKFCQENSRSLKHIVAKRVLQFDEILLSAYELTPAEDTDATRSPRRNKPTNSRISILPGAQYLGID